MGRYLTDLADVCRRTGRPVIEVDGWQTRARGGAGGDKTGGYEADAPSHVIVHHTASGPSSDPMNGGGDVTYCATGHPDAPVGNLYLSRDGSIYVMAGGAANTNGSGHDPCGLVADDNMNAKSLAVEAGNAGTGEPWAEAQQSSYVALVAELGAAYGIAPERVHSHFELAPGRKIDPAGESRYASGSSMWAMELFRADVAGAPPPEPTPEPEPEPEPEPTPPEEDFMANLPTIKRGDTGDYVERMQHLLAAAGYMNPANTANYDGVWGSGTDGAKARFDADHGLGGSDTSCGPKSWESLMTGRVW